MLIPKLYQISAEYPVAVAYDVSLQPPFGYILLHRAFTHSKDISAVFGFEPCCEAHWWLFSTHGGSITYSTYFFITVQYLPLTQFLAFGQVSHLNWLDVMPIVLLHCQFTNLFILLATPTTFQRVGHRVGMTSQLCRNLHIRASRRRYLS